MNSLKISNGLVNVSSHKKVAVDETKNDALVREEREIEQQYISSNENAAICE